MKRTLVILSVIVMILSLVGCTSSSPGYVVVTPNPLPVTGTVIATVPNPLPVNINGVTTIEDARLGVMSKDYFVGVAEGDVAGHSKLTKFGYNPTVGIVEEDIWFGSNTYVFPTVAQQMELTSSSIEDDPIKADLAVGTGIHSVTITYLDNTYAQQTEDVTLNGQGVVTTTAVNIFRVNDIRAKTTGTGYKAAGNIVIRNLADTPAYRYIGASYTRGRCSTYTVPLGKTLYIQDWYVGVGGLNATNNTKVTLRATYEDNAGTITTAGLFFFPMAEVMIPNGSIIREFIIPIKIPATVDIKISAINDAGSSFIETSFRGWTEP